MPRWVPFELALHRAEYTMKNERDLQDAAVEGVVVDAQNLLRVLEWAEGKEACFAVAVELGDLRGALADAFLGGQ
jgi:hypothetical protein